MRKDFFNSSIRFVIAVVSVCLVAAASLSAQTPSGDPRPRPTSTAGARSSRNHPELRNSSRARERAWRIRQAEEEAAEARAREARAREARADREKREREQVWYVAVIRNRTKNPIAYKYTCGGAWKETTIKPGWETTLTRRNESVDVKFESGGQTKQYRVEALKVVGHKPTESDEEEAESKANLFKLDANGNVELYSKR